MSGRERFGSTPERGQSAYPLSPGDPATGRPPLGKVDISPKRTCTRLLGTNSDLSEHLCDKPAVEHVDWGPAAGFVCAEHLAEIGHRWHPKAQHPLGPYCGMPGALWFDFKDGTSKCEYDADGLPEGEPVRAVALEVPA